MFVRRKHVLSRKIVAKMSCRSVHESQINLDRPGSMAVNKVKNNFSIDHLLAKGPEPVQSSPSGQTHIALSNERLLPSVQFTPNFGTSPDSSFTNYAEDYLDNASEAPSEDSFENGTDIPKITVDR